MSVTQRISSICTGSIARRRMTSVASTAIMYGLASAGLEILLPLWVTKDLGLTPSDFANLRALRMCGIFGGVIILGALSDRYGQRLVGAISMLCEAVILVFYAQGGPKTLWLLMPLLGAMVSTGMVNINALTQMISVRKSGLANSIYRGISTGMGVIAPILVTVLAARMHGYAPVLMWLAGLLVVSALLLLTYPCETLPAVQGNAVTVTKEMWQSYVRVLRKQRLMRYMHISLVSLCCLSGVSTFAAIRFTRELGLSDQRFGVLTAVAGLLSLGTIAWSGIALDRKSLKTVHLVVGFMAAAATIAMGLSSTITASAIAYLVVSPVLGLSMIPTSMWVGRESGQEMLTTAFSVHKVISALYFAIAMLAFGFLEKRFGIQMVLISSGIAGAIFTCGFFFMPDSSLKAYSQE